MSALRVWAPAAERVEVVSGSARTPMQRTSEGFYVLEDPPLTAGGEYAFSLDGGEPLPDPRSPWQPRGVHGPSRRIDHAAFPWSDARWQAPPLASGLIYELHVGTFTPEGTFASAIARLDHLVELGVTHVELMPVAEFPGRRGWGYDGVQLYAPHHAYGGPDGLKTLVDACHARGLAVLLDVVYNHLGPDGNVLPCFGPYFTDRYATPWGAALNLDGAGSDPVRRYLCDNALAWLRDYHLDGLRIDAVHAIVDTSAVHLLEQLAEEVEVLEAELGRHLVLVAESDLNDPRVVRPREIGGYGIDAQWNEDFHHALHVALTGERDGYYRDFEGLADVARTLTSTFVYDGRFSAHRGRRHGRPATGLSGHRFVGFLQNHDQVGNRARGERLSHLVPPERLEAAAALLLTAPFVPMLFMGEEWGARAPFPYFTDHQDPELGRAVREGRQRAFAAFDWAPEDIADPQAPETFARSALDWGECAREPHRRILDWHRRLVALRRRAPELKDGRLDRVEVAFDAAQGWIRMARGRLTVACHLGEEEAQLPLPPGRPAAPLLASAPGVAVTEGSVRLPPSSAVVLGPPNLRP
jgi:maltooligosyltrehalose trehalohydrolase